MFEAPSAPASARAGLSRYCACRLPGPSLARTYPAARTMTTLTIVPACASCHGADDGDLGEHRRPGGKTPPPGGGSHGEQRRSSEDEHGAASQSTPGPDPDGLREGGHLGPPESLGDAQQMEQPVAGEHRDERPTDHCAEGHLGPPLPTPVVVRGESSAGRRKHLDPRRDSDLARAAPSTTPGTTPRVARYPVRRAGGRLRHARSCAQSGRAHHGTGPSCFLRIVSHPW